MNIEEEAKKIKDKFSSLIKQYKKNEKIKKEGVSLDSNFKARDEYLNKEIALFFKEYGRFIKTRKNSIGTFSVEDYMSYMKIELQRKGNVYHEAASKNNYSMFMNPHKIDQNEFHYNPHTSNLNVNYKSYISPPHVGEFSNQPDLSQNNYFIENKKIKQNQDYKPNAQVINDTLYRNTRFRGHNMQPNMTLNDFNRPQDIHNGMYIKQNNISPIIYTSKNDLYPTMKFKNNATNLNDFGYNNLYEGLGSGEKFNHQRQPSLNLQKEKSISNEHLSGFKETSNFYKNVYNAGSITPYENDIEGASFGSSKKIFNDNFDYMNAQQEFRRYDKGSFNNSSPGDNLQEVKASKVPRSRAKEGMKNEEYIDNGYKNKYYESRNTSPSFNGKNVTPQSLNSFRERIFSKHKNAKQGIEDYQSNMEVLQKRMIRSANVGENPQYNRNIYRDRPLVNGTNVYNNMKNHQFYRENVNTQNNLEKISPDKVFYEKKLWENPSNGKINFTSVPYQTSFVHNNDFTNQGISSVNTSNSYYYDKYLKNEISISDFINDKNNKTHTNYNDEYLNSYNKASTNRILQSGQVYGSVLKNEPNNNYKGRYLRTEPIGKPIYDSKEKSIFTEKPRNVSNFKKSSLENDTRSQGFLTNTYSNIGLSNHRTQNTVPIAGNNKFSSFGYNKIYNNIIRNNVDGDKFNIKNMHHDATNQTLNPRVDVQNAPVGNNTGFKDNEMSGFCIKQQPLNSGFFKQGVKNEEKSFALSSSTSDDQDKYFLEDLIKEIGAVGVISKGSKELMYEICDNFIEHMIVMSNAIAFHRNSNNVEIKDIRLAFKSECNFELPDETILNKNILDGKSTKMEVDNGEELNESDGKSEFTDKSCVQDSNR